MLNAVLNALQLAFSMTWEITWALILGFFLSAVVQAVVHRHTITRFLGDDQPRTLVRAAGLGAASSSCSYAAVALARSLFRKGANFTAAIAFEIASTNLVIELGTILILLMGWQFALGQFVGGPIMIVVIVVLFRLFLRPRLLAPLARPRPSGRRRSSCWYRAAGPSPCPVWPHLQGRRRYARQGQVSAPGAVGRPAGIEGPVVVFTLHDEKGFPTMSVTAPPARQKPSILAAFTAAPTLVKVLAAILYAIGLLTLIQVAQLMVAGGRVVPQDRLPAAMVVLSAVVVAVVSVVLGWGITRGVFGSWLLTLIVTVLFAAQRVLWMATAATGVRTVLAAGAAVAVLAMLLTPAVRQHCAKR